LYTEYNIRMEFKITRMPLRDQVYHYIREKIISGSLTPGEKIRDTDFVEDLGISRTPMREVLLRLVREGFLLNHMGRGFEVTSLDRREIEEIYPIIGTLESLALKSSPPAKKRQLEDLQKILLKMKKKNLSPLDYLALDEQWHDLLLMGCSNHKLLEILKQLKNTMKRYELAYVHSSDSIEDSLESHHVILQILKTGNQQQAADVLQQHWNLSIKALMKKINPKTNDQP
jgi:DNA-binding GntR family transcriptional regulator